MSTRKFDVQIEEVVVDSRLRMTRARIEQAILEEVEQLLRHNAPAALQLDPDGAIVIPELRLSASNAMSSARLGEAVAHALSAPLVDAEHPARTPLPTRNSGGSK